MNFKNYIKSLTVGLTSVSFFAGCAPPKDTTALVTSGFKMTGSASTATVAKQTPKSIWSLLETRAYALMPTSVLDSTGLTITLNQAWTVVKEIEFKSGEVSGAEDSKLEVEFQGPYVVNLLSNAPVTLDTQQIAQKAIKRIKMKLHKAETLPSSAPSGLLNNSIFISGVVGSNNFTFQLDDSTEIQIGGPNGFQPGENSELLVEIQLANIFKQIDMSSITNNEVISSTNRHSGTNLCSSIDTSASDIYTCIRKGLEKHANFGQDTDGNNDLDSYESKVR